MLLQLIVNGIIMGSIYSLVALGFALVYNTTKIFHMAYSAIYVFAAYMFYAFYVLLHFHLFLSILISLVLTVILSLLIEVFVYKPIENKGSSLNILMVSSIGLMIIVINFIAMFFGNDTKILNSNIVSSVSIRNILLTKVQIAQFLISTVIIAAFLVLLKFTKLGIKTRAIRDDKILSAIFGIRIFKLRILLFSLSAVFAGIGSSLVAFDVGVDPYVGLPMFLNAVVALIIGGIGRFEAPIIGGFVIGILQAMTVYVFSSRWQDAVTFLLLLLFLLFRPQGILGEKKRLV